MSVIIKGMEMPKVCDDCGWYYWSNIDQEYKCRLTDTGLRVKNVMLERGVDCPLIEIPKNARLIDAHEVMEKISRNLNEPNYQHEGEDWAVGLIMAGEHVDDAKTIYEEEE